MADEDVPPLEDCSELLAGVGTTAKSAAPPSRQQPPIAAAPRSASTGSHPAATTATAQAQTSDWGTPEQEMLQKQMIDAALASEPAMVAEMKTKEKKVTDEFGKGTAFKAGFLLGSGSKKFSKTPATAPISKPASKSQAADATVVVPTASAAASSLVLPEVQRAMADGMTSLQKTVTETSVLCPSPRTGNSIALTHAMLAGWMTPELMARIAKEPRLLAAMSDPKFMGALSELQQNPKAAMEKYKV
jgi:hypothetical protein